MLYGASSPGGKAKTAVDDLDEVYKPAPEEEYTIPLGVADIKRPGRDVTLVATGYMMHKSIRAAKALAKEGIEVEVIDPRTLFPLDQETILKSVEKTGRMVVVSEDVGTCGFTAEIAAVVAENALFSLDAPIKRVCVQHTPIPFAPNNEMMVIPQEQDIITAVKSAIYQ
jgi:pyruvate/2-oxoglutarate/acetoin dehydrogenase E1 component